MGNLVLNGSTSGAVTLTPPAVAGSNTLTLPAATGTVLVPSSSGSTGQVLTTNGTTPSWVNGWTLINSTTASAAASLADTTSLTSTYANYMIIVKNLSPVTSAVSVSAQIQSGGSFQTTGYLGNAWATVAVNITTGIPLCVASRFGNTYPSQFTFWLTSPSSTSVYKHISGNGSYYDTGNSQPIATTVGGLWTTGTGAITGFQLVSSSGNISGTMQIYGSN